MLNFFLTWIGQTISTVGSDMTEFALGVWVYEQTGSVTQFALISLCIYLPRVLISPVAGALVDRGDRRYWMILSDSACWVITLIVMVLTYSNSLEVWHIYLAVIAKSSFNAFQIPAYTASVPLLVPPHQLARANGMVQGTRATARIAAPVVAGFLVTIIHIQGILLIDSLTFIVAIITLLIARFPLVKKTSSSYKKINFTQLYLEILTGWNYINARRGLVGLLMLFSVINFTEGVLQVLFWPLILSFSSSQNLGIILFISGCGMLLGSILMTTWGGPKRRIYGIFILVPFQGLLLLLGGIRPSLILAAIGAFGYLFATPIIISCNQTIWQTKIPPKIQGRVFALQQMLEKILAIIAYIISGPLTDRVFEPLMAEKGLLANSLGQVMGVGQGRGIGLFFVLIGILNIVVTFISCKSPRIRRIEKELPDQFFRIQAIR
jgi:MFS family permease